MKKRMICILALMLLILGGCGKTDPGTEVKTEEPKTVGSVDVKAPLILSTENGFAPSDVKGEQVLLPLEEKKVRNLTTGSEELTPNQTDTMGCVHEWTPITVEKTLISSHLVPNYTAGENDNVVETNEGVLCGICLTHYKDQADYEEHDICFGSFGTDTIAKYYKHSNGTKSGDRTVIDLEEKNDTMVIGYKCTKCGEELN